MKFLLKPVIRWFGYSRRERRASAVLLLIMVLVMVFRYAIPEKSFEIEDLSALLLPEITESPNSGPVKILPAGNNLKEYGNSDNRIIRFQSKKTELNSCDSADLERLPGIGPVLSARIIKYRNLLGGYVSVAQLKEVYGLSDSTYLIICNRVSADSTLVKRIDINSATFNELNRHPYLERYDAQAILKYRDLQGRITGISDLTRNNIMTGERASRVLPYLQFD